MVVLSAAVVVQGKTLLARQFVEMTRLRIEGLLSGFQNLVGTGKDHTFIETETVRYVHQPIGALQLVLVTNRSSNILEDIETMRLMAKVMQDCCQVQVNEELVLKNALEIVFAFDEVISFGHRDSVTMSQIKSYTEMDSHEEKHHRMIEQGKINATRQEARKRQAEISKQKLSVNPEGRTPATESFGGGAPSTDRGRAPISFSGTTGTGGSSFQDTPSSSGLVQEFTPSAMNMGGLEDSDKRTFRPTSCPRNGMVLGKRRPSDVFVGSEMPSPVEEPFEAELPVPAHSPLLDPVRVEIEERITGELSLEGGLQGEAMCTGQFQVTVLDPSKADLASFKLNQQDQSFKYQVHPNLNKASYSNNALEVKDNTRAFRANQAAPLLKWQLKSTDEAFFPVQISCWPSSTAEGTQMVVELELTDMSAVLEDVRISFPAPASSRPSVCSASRGEFACDGNGVHWTIMQLDSVERSGTLEFVAAADHTSLVPGEFTATCRGKTRCPVEVLECYHLERREPISLGLTRSSVYQLKIGG
jgi:hypothetical protein